MYANVRTAAAQGNKLQADHTPLPAASAMRDAADGSPGQLSPLDRHAKLAPDAVEPFRT